MAGTCLKEHHTESRSLGAPGKQGPADSGKDMGIVAGCKNRSFFIPGRKCQIENEKVSWCLGVLVSRFLGFLVVGFLVSKFLGFKVSRIQ